MIDIWGTPVMAEIEDIVDMLQIELRAANSHLLADRKLTGRNLMLTCISHGDGMERNPSMGILLEDVRRGKDISKAGSVNCFTCGYTVDLAELVSNCFGKNDKGMFGFKWITSNFVNLSIESRRDLILDMDRNARSDAPEERVSDEELDSYRYFHPYMYERKLNDRVIEYFDIGYCKKTDCLTFPVHDLRGIPLFLQRRSVSAKRFQNDVTTLKGTVLYGMYQVYRNISWIKELYVTESIIDALTLWRHRKAAVATLQAIPTVTQLELLKRVPIRKIVCAHDNDKAGRKGAMRIKESIGDYKLIHRAIFDAKDVNELDDDEVLNMRDRIL